MGVIRRRFRRPRQTILIRRFKRRRRRCAPGCRGARISRSGWRSSSRMAAGCSALYRNRRRRTQLDRPEDGRQYVVGVDWGVADATVFSVLDATRKAQVYQDRMVGADYAAQRSRLHALTRHWHPAVIMAEYNSMGGPLVEQLQQDGLPVQAFTTTNATKRLLIDGLSLAFENREITIMNDPITVGELQAYEMQTLASGMIRFGAPEGVHDDCVMALALAWYAATSTPSGQLMY